MKRMGFPRILYSRDGAGNYSLPEAPYQDGQVIDDDSVNANLADIATALTGSMARDGQSPPTNDMPWGNRKITDLADGTNDQDAVNVGQVPTLARPGIAYVEDAAYGAVGDGVTDDSTAIQAALDSSATLVICRPGATYQISTGLVIPAGKTFDLQGATIRGDAGLAAVVTYGTVGTFGTVVLRNGRVTRSGGAPSSTTVGVDIVDGYRHLTQNIYSDNHGIPYRVRSITLTYGIHCRFEECNAGRASGVFIDIDTWPEVYWTGGRIGENGTTDYACTAYIRIQGGLNGAGHGPNTINFVNVHFNSGGTPATNGPDYAIQFVDQTAALVGQALELFNFVNCHFEGYQVAAIMSDSSWATITGLNFTNVNFNESTAVVLALHANTRLFKSAWVGTKLHGASFTYQPTTSDPTQNFDLLGCHIPGPVTISTSASGSTMSLIGGTLASLTISGTWHSFRLDAMEMTDPGTGFDMSAAAGNIDANFLPENQTDFTPSISFGGGSTGITYAATRNGRYQINGRMITVVVEIVLTNKGSSTGTATLGLPVTSGEGGGDAIAYITNMSSLTGQVTLAVNPAEGVAYFLMAGASGMTNLTDANFTNTSTFRATFTYLLR